MSEPTPEQLSAQKKLQEAVEQHIRAYTPEGEGSLVVEWALVAHVVDPADPHSAIYPLAYSDGEMPNHRAYGLFGWAARMVSGGLEGD